MKTFLLYWNPFFSSYTPQRFQDDFRFPEGKDVLTDEDEWDRSPAFFNWSVLEHEKAHEGDRFIFIRVGYEKPTGMVGVGHFTSEPYIDRDWSGQGRKVYYLDMDWESVINPASDKILKTEVLSEIIPEIDWTKGKSGVEVAPEIAERIESLWKKHLQDISNVTQEQKKAVGKACHEALEVMRTLVTPGIYTRNSETGLHPDSKVSARINGKEILTTEAELEKVLKELED